MNLEFIRKTVIATTIMVCSLVSNSSVLAKQIKSTTTTQFATIAALTGEWQVQELPSLRIVFEKSVGGSVIIEKWIRGNETHSLTIYHLDGERLIATHYYPQGNQPRLSAPVSDMDVTRFTFLDVTDLDPGEFFQHDLSFELHANGTVLRAETYWGPDGAREESTLTLIQTKKERE